MSTPLRERPDAPLGTLIFRAGLLPAETIENALEEGVRTGRRLGEILIDRGLLREDDLAPLLAGQKGLPFVRLAEEGVDPSAARLLAEEQARLFQALPIGHDEDVPVVAVTDPTNETLMRNVRDALGGEARLVVVTREDLNDAIGRIYGQNGNHAESEAQSAVPLLATPEAQPEPAFVAEPEPEFLAEPAPEPEPEVLPAAAPAPAAEMEPAPEAPAPQPPAAPAEPPPAPSPPVAETPPAPVQAPAPPPVVAPETVVSFQPPAREPEPEKRAFRVTVRLANDEPFVVAECGDLDEAKGQAQDVIRQLAEASAGDWPFVNGRFLKPDSILSIDVERL
jgi:hypothetical protein